MSRKPSIVFDGCLTSGVVTRGGNGLETSLVNWLAATRANPVASFLNTQQRLIDVRDELGTAFTKSQRNLFIEILHGKIHAVFDTVVVKFECGRLVCADLFGVLA